MYKITKEKDCFNLYNNDKLLCKGKKETLERYTEVFAIPIQKELREAIKDMVKRNNNKA